MKKSMQSAFLVLTVLTVLLSGCAPVSTPAPATVTPSPIPPTIAPSPTQQPIPPTFTPEPTATATPIPSPTPLPAVISDTNVQNLKVFSELGKGAYPSNWTNNNVSWSPDGKEIAIPTTAGVSLVDVETMKEEALNTGRADSVAFSPDGKYLATSSGVIWDLENHAIAARFPVDDWGGRFVAFSNDGKSVTIHNSNQKLVRWNLLSSEIDQTIVLDDNPASGVISKEGSTIAFVDSDLKKVRLYDATTGKRLKGFKPIEYRDKIYRVVFSPDGNTLAITGFENSPVKLWDAHTGTLIKNLEGDFQWMFGISFSPDGKTVLASSYVKPLRFWDVESGKVIRTVNRTGDFVFFSPDGSKIALGNLWDNSINIMMTDSERILGEIQGFFGIYDFNFANESPYIYSSCSGDKYCRWDYENGTYKIYESGLQGNLYAVNTNGIAAFGGEVVQMGDLNKQEILCNTKQRYASGVEVSDDGLFVILASLDGFTFGYGSRKVLWDINKCQIISYFKDFIGNFTFDNKLVTINKTGKLNIQSIGSNELKSSVQLEKFEPYNLDVGISPDSNLLVGTQGHEDVYFWSLKDGRLIYTLKLEAHSQAGSPTFSPDGRLFAIEVDGKIVVYKIAN